MRPIGLYGKKTDLKGADVASSGALPLPPLPLPLPPLPPPLLPPPLLLLLLVVVVVVEVASGGSGVVGGRVALVGRLVFGWCAGVGRLGSRNVMAGRMSQHWRKAREWVTMAWQTLTVSDAELSSRMRADTERMAQESRTMMRETEARRDVIRSVVERIESVAAESRGAAAGTDIQEALAEVDWGGDHILRKFVEAEAALEMDRRTDEVEQLEKLAAGLREQLVVLDRAVAYGKGEVKDLGLAGDVGGDAVGAAPAEHEGVPQSPPEDVPKPT